MATEVASAYVTLMPSFKGGKRAIEKQLNGVVTPASQKAGRGGGIAAGVALASGLKRAALPAVAVVGGLLGTALTKGFQRLTAIENAEAKLRGLGHSAGSVQKIMDSALKAVKGTAFGLDEAATIAASTVAAGVKPGKELERILRLVGDAATIAGSDLGEMGAIFNKVAAGNRLSMEEVNQLLDRGIPILTALSKEYGVTATEMRKMISEGEVDFPKFAAVMEEMLGGAALKSGETTQGAFKNTMAALSRFGAALLQNIFPMVRGALVGITEWIDKATEAVGPLAKQLAERLGPVFQTAGKYVETFFKALRGYSFGGLTGPMKIVAQVGTTLRGVFQGLVSAIQGAGTSAAFKGLQSFFTSLGSAFKTVGPAVGQFVQTVLPPLMRLGQQIMALVGPALRDIGNIIKTQLAPAFAEFLPVVAPVAKFLIETVGGGVVEALKGAIQFIKGALETIAGVIRLFSAIFKGDWSAAWEAVKKIGSGIWEAIKGAFKVFINVGIGKVLGLGMKLVSKLWSTAWNGVKSLGTKMWEGIKSLVKRGVDAVVKFMKSLPGKAMGAIRSLAGSTASFFGGLWSKASSATSSGVSKVVGFMRQLPSKGMSAVKSLSVSFAKFILNMWNKARTAVSQGISKVVGLVRQLPGKIRSAAGSMGSVLVNAGRNVIRGLIRGIQNMIGAVRAKLREITNMLPDWKGPMRVDMRILEPSGEAVMDGFLRGVENRVNTLRSTLGDVTAMIPSAVGAPALAGASAAGGVSYGDIHVTVQANDLNQVQSVIELFETLQQESRRMRPSR